MGVVNATNNILAPHGIKTVGFISPRATTQRAQLFADPREFVKLDYVREATASCISHPLQRFTRRTHPVAQHLYGFAVIGKSSRYCYNCKFWHLKDHDRPLDPNGPYALSPEQKNDPLYKHCGPIEARDPLDVLKQYFPELVGEVNFQLLQVAPLEKTIGRIQKLKAECDRILTSLSDAEVLQ